MLWLQSWDGLLVNWVGRQLTASPELKTLVRTGVPPAYRSRVWKALVNITVKDKLAELGNGYFQSMLRKATNKIDEGIYDSAIKQVVYFIPILLFLRLILIWHGLCRRISSLMSQVL